MLIMSWIIVLLPLLPSAFSLRRVSIGNKTFDIETKKEGFGGEENMEER